MEFALVFCITLLVFFSIVEFGLFMNARLVVTTAAREGARRAAVDGGASQAAYARISDVLNSSGLSQERCQVAIEPQVAAFGSSVRARVEYVYTVRAPLVSLVAGRDIPVVSEVVFRSERVR